jgi:hypothetical protein
MAQVNYSSFRGAKTVLNMGHFRYGFQITVIVIWFVSRQAQDMHRSLLPSAASKAVKKITIRNATDIQ